jgi:hypothetical protein
MDVGSGNPLDLKCSEERFQVCCGGRMPAIDCDVGFTQT